MQPTIRFAVKGHECLLFAHEVPQVLIIQPIDENELDYIAHEVELLEAATSTPFALLAFRINDWEADLAPWPDANLKRSRQAGQKAADTLRFVEDQLLPYLQDAYTPLPCILGGYSLAALWALWAGYASESFRAIAAASPSVWLQGWMDYAQTHQPKARHIYLSLGDREEKTRHPAFSTIGDNIRAYHDLLTLQLPEGSVKLEWNAGNHFAENDVRMAKALAWAVNQLADRTSDEAVTMPANDQPVSTTLPYLPLSSTSLLAFDADDTLWDNQSHFDRVQKTYAEIMSPWGNAEHTAAELFARETANMPTLGYGCKAFTITLVENAIAQSHGEISVADIERIVALGKQMLTLPATPLPGVKETLQWLHQWHPCPIIVFTKGELLDQENKLRRSGLEPLVDDIVVVSDKTPQAYQRLCRQQAARIEDLIMVGNSFKSDIAPVLQLGGRAIHIPFHTTWQHEVVEEYDHERLVRLTDFEQLKTLFQPR